MTFTFCYMATVVLGSFSISSFKKLKPISSIYNVIKILFGLESSSMTKLIENEM